MTTMNEKLRRKTQEEIGSIVINPEQPMISRNGIKGAKRAARSRHGSFGLSCDTSYGVSASLGAQMELIQGYREQECPSDLPIDVQIKKMQKAAEKRARKAGKWQ